MISTLSSWDPIHLNLKETEAFAYMADIPEEIAKKFEEQARTQQAQHEMLQV